MSQEHLSTEQVLQAAKKQKRDSLELLFFEAWLDTFPTLPVPQRQWRHTNRRKWRWDFAWPEQRLLVDLQGQTFHRGAHSRGLGQERDFEKWNDAVASGFRPLVFGTKAMDRPQDVVEFVASVLCNMQEVP